MHRFNALLILGFLLLMRRADNKPLKRHDRNITIDSRIQETKELLLHNKIQIDINNRFYSIEDYSERIRFIQRYYAIH